MKKMKFLIGAILLMTFVSSTSKFTSTQVGDVAALFNLINVDDTMVSLEGYAKKGAIVIFTCNHCPYVKAYEDRIIALHSKFKDTYPVITISSNDPESFPDDSFEKMKIRAKEKGFEFPYLFDETQEIAKLYGALKTPHVYLLNKEKDAFVIKYIGAIDDNTYDASQVKEKYLESAVSSLINGEEIKNKETKAIGCSIKWKS